MITDIVFVIRYREICGQRRSSMLGEGGYRLSPSFSGRSKGHLWRSIWSAVNDKCLEKGSPVQKFWKRKTGRLKTACLSSSHGSKGTFAACLEVEQRESGTIFKAGTCRCKRGEKRKPQTERGDAVHTTHFGWKKQQESFKGCSIKKWL